MKKKKKFAEYYWALDADGSTRYTYHIWKESSDDKYHSIERIIEDWRYDGIIRTEGLIDFGDNNSCIIMDTQRRSYKGYYKVSNDKDLKGREIKNKIMIFLMVPNFTNKDGAIFHQE